MTVYAPSDQALVVVAGSDEGASGLQSALTRLLGGVGAVALGSVVVDRLARAGAAPAPTAEDAGAGGAGAGANDSVTAEPTADPTATAEPTPTETAADLTETAVETTHGAAGGGSDPLATAAAAVSGLPPGALFFLGGLLALLFVTAARLR